MALRFRRHLRHRRVESGVVDWSRAEELLYEREQRLQIATEAANMGMWDMVVEAEAHAPLTDGDMQKIFDTMCPTPRAEQMIGLKPGEYRSFRDWENRIHPNDRDRIFESLRSVISSGQPHRVYDSEVRYVWPDGSIHWIHCRGMLFRDREGALQRFMGVSIDVTPRRQAEEEIRRRNERLQFVSGCLAQLLAEHDPDRIVAHFFAEMAPHIGADACVNFHVDDETHDLVLHISHGIPEETKRRVHRLRFSEDTSGMLARALSVLVANDIQHSNSTDPAVALLRELGFQCFVGFPLMVGDHLLGTLGFAAKGKPEFAREDIDFLRLVAEYVAIAIQRTRAEQAVFQSKEAAETANRTKDLFIASLSHELRTPLTPALMIANSLEQDETLASPLREQMRLVRRCVELEARLVDNLLDVTRVERGKFFLRPERVDVHELLAQALEIVREDIQLKKLDLKMDSSAERIISKGDPARLQQVFWNLLINAIKFTPSGGSIHIRSFNPNEQSLSVEIRDTGIGISPENLEKIFNTFEQGAAAGDHRYGGLGLGLAISKFIVEMHGGTITAASEGINHGASFTICLPIVEMAEQAPAMKPSRREQPAAHLHILLVEDHEQTRAVLASLLSRDGHEVQTADTCAAALQAAHALVGTRPFDVLISDIGLPDGSGLNLARQLKAETPDMIAIALSGYGTHEDLDRSTQAGFDAHLIKPIGIEDIRGALAQDFPTSRDKANKISGDD